MSIGFADVMQGAGLVAIFATGIRMIVAPENWQHDRSEKRERALVERLARGHDRYFEELRALQAYSQPRSLRTIRLFGVALVVIAAMLLILSIIQF
ncbi:MAG: hypothetical protein ABW023_08690 [Sphingomonas sp.]